jgi:hypothetical protein
MPRKHKMLQHLLLLLISDHRCIGADHLGKRHATCVSIANKVSRLLQDTPTYRPKGITSDVRRAHGVSVPYMQAWRAKERAYKGILQAFSNL